jgi:hypothetical protein
VFRTRPQTKHPDTRLLFDAKWYAKRNALGGEDAAWQHYCRQQDIHRPEPNPLFDSRWYLAGCPSASADPLEHFLRSDPASAPNPSPFFDRDWYLANSADVREAGINPYRHYIEWGRHEGRLPNRWCDPAYTGEPIFDPEVPDDFTVDDLLGYIPHYTTMARLISGAEATSFFSPKNPSWIFAKVASSNESPDADTAKILLGGRREVFSGSSVHTADANAASLESYRAFQVRYAISPIIRNAVTVLGRDYDAVDVREELAHVVAHRQDLSFREINVVVDASRAHRLRAQLTDSPLAALNFITLEAGYLCRAKLLKAKAA